jgi:hypothetical protein
MTKHAALVFALMLLFAGVGSAAVAGRAPAPAKHLSAAIKHEKRLGPKPTPRWYWRWADWRLGEGFAQDRAHQHNLRPQQLPARVPHWAWQRLHYFLLARAIKGHARTSTTRKPPSSRGSSGIGLLNYGGHLASFTHNSLYHLVVGDAWDGDAKVLASGPGLGLAYFSGADVNTGYSTGVPYSQASQNGWLLRNSSGSLLVNKGYPSNYVGDVGSAAYQRAWIANVEKYLAGHPGIDGIFIDDVVFDLRDLASTEAAKYSTQPQWGGAMLSFVEAVHAALHRKGYYVAVNASGYIPGDANSNTSANTQTWWRKLGPYVDGLMNEYYDETPTGTDQLRTSGTAWYQGWSSWQQLIGLAQSMGDDFIGLEKGSSTNTTAMTYGKASFLLEWNGGGSVFMYSARGSDPTNGAWTTNIGKPARAKVRVGAGWERAYTGGTVLVNPSASASQTFTVKGKSYTLAPTTARILKGS